MNTITIHNVKKVSITESTTLEKTNSEAREIVIQYEENGQLCRFEVSLFSDTPEQTVPQQVKNSAEVPFTLIA